MNIREIVFATVLMLSGSAIAESPLDSHPGWAREGGALVLKEFKIDFDARREPTEQFRLVDPEGRELGRSPILAELLFRAEDMIKQRDVFKK